MASTVGWSKEDKSRINHLRPAETGGKTRAGTVSTLEKTLSTLENSIGTLEFSKVLTVFLCLPTHMVSNDNILISMNFHRFSFRENNRSTARKSQIFLTALFRA